MDENHNFSALIPQLVESTAPDGAISVDVKSADYRLGNLCNLACRMCSPRSSTPWLKYSISMADSGIQPFTREQWDEFSNYNWYESPQFIEHVQAQMPSLEHLHFAGGEPLINPQMGALLKKCVEQGCAKNIKLTYNTNLTRISDELKALWPEFKSVHLYISVDAYGKLNEYIRHPSRWRDIDANLRDIDDNFAKYGIEYAAIMTTAQLYNIFRLDELYDYLFANMKNVMKLPKLIDLYVPTPLRTQALPAHLKTLAKARMHAILEKAEERLNNGLIRAEEAGTLDSLRGSIAFIDLEDRSDELSQFWSYTLELDRLHKKSTLDFIPELQAVMPVIESQDEIATGREPAGP